MEVVQPLRRAVRFGVFEVDLHAGELRKQSLKIKLQEQPFQILQILLEHPGKVVTREQLRQRVWPSDTFVDFEQGLYNAIKRLRDALGDTAETPRYIETLPRKGYRFIGSLEAGARRIESLVVLPLENLSRDPEQEYFADGLTEALITTLAKIGALRVISRTSAMRYKKTDKTMPQIARELNVDAVVEGTVQRSGKRLRISAQLVYAPEDKHLWAESYERDLRDVLALQSEVARAIANEIQVKLTPQEQANLAQVHPIDPEAYEAYLKGRYHSSRRSAEGFAKAVQYFQQAIAQDPAYAAAYAGLSDCLSGLGVWGLVPPDEGFGKGKRLALQALEIDQSLAEAHASLAYAAMWHDYDFLAAERGFERSIELNPRYSLAHAWFGFYLATMGRYEESYTELQRALRLDPLSSIFHFLLATTFWLARRYDQGIEYCEKALELDTHLAQAQFGLAAVYSEKAMHDQAIAAARKGVELSQGDPLFLAFLAAAYAAGEHLQEAHEILRQLNELSKQRYVTPYGVARIYAALGETDEAIRWLETAYRERAAWMILLKTDPKLDPLRPDPRFRDLLRRMNFPE